MNVFQQKLPDAVFRELFRRAPWALFDRLTPEQTEDIKRHVVKLRDEMQSRVMRRVLSLSPAEREQLLEDIAALNSVLE